MHNILIILPVSTLTSKAGSAILASLDTLKEGSLLKQSMPSSNTSVPNVGAMKDSKDPKLYFKRQKRLFVIKERFLLYYKNKEIVVRRVSIICIGH
jgi:hypothetical protein